MSGPADDDGTRVRTPLSPPFSSGDEPAPPGDHGYGFCREALTARDAAALVHVADRSDPDQRYLTRLAGPDRPYAFVHDGERATLLAPSLYVAEARRTFPGDEVLGPDGTPGPADGHPAERVAALLERRLGDDAAVDGDGDGDGDWDGDSEGGPDDARPRPTLLVPRQLPHDAAVHLERAGFRLASTDAVVEARTTKTGAEVAAVRRAQTAAADGVARAAAVLADTTPAEPGPVDGSDATATDRGTASDPAPDDAEGDPAPVLLGDDEPLTTGRLRRAVDATLAAAGVDPAGNTVVASGPACRDLHYRGDRPIRAGETVVVDASPRGPAGYHGDCTRTFVVAGGGGWERRAHVAVVAARRAALDAVEPGVPARRVHEAAAAELSAYGFPADYDGEEGFVHSVGHGVGLALHEAPRMRSGAPLRTGATLAIEPGVYDPSVGGVRVEDVVVVTDDGPELLVERSTGLSPAAFVERDGEVE